MIEILSTRLANTVQDRGRAGFLDAGVSLCGALDGPVPEACIRLRAESVSP